MCTNKTTFLWNVAMNLLRLVFCIASNCYNMGTSALRIHMYARGPRAEGIHP